MERERTRPSDHLTSQLSRTPRADRARRSQTVGDAFRKVRSFSVSPFQRIDSVLSCARFLALPQGHAWIAGVMHKRFTVALADRHERQREISARSPKVLL